jgi:hypothetical protein
MGQHRPVSAMDFPSFGDATFYASAGRACAEALTTEGGSPFAACYDRMRPIGIVAWSTLPFLVARDPVDVAYATLALNVVLLAAVHAAFVRLLSMDPALRGGPLSPRAWSWVVFVPALLLLVPHLPVTLSDLPSLAAFLPALLMAARILHDPAGGPRTRRYFVLGLLVCGAALVRQHYLAFGAFLLAATLWLDAAPWRERARCVAAFAAGLAPLALQVANVYAHSGEVWLYERSSVAETFGRPNKHLIIEALFYSTPQPGGFMVKLTEARSWPTVIVLRLFSGLFKFQWAVYQGRIPPALEWWTPTAFELARAFTAVLGWAALTVYTALRGPLSLRLLNGTALLSALVVPAFGVGHSEPRYFLFPRLVLAVTAAYWLARAARARRAP